jgi:hypothetical protein
MDVLTRLVPSESAAIHRSDSPRMSHTTVAGVATPTNRTRARTRDLRLMARAHAQPGGGDQLEKAEVDEDLHVHLQCVATPSRALTSGEAERNIREPTIS